MKESNLQRCIIPKTNLLYILIAIIYIDALGIPQRFYESEISTVYLIPIPPTSLDTGTSSTFDVEHPILKVIRMVIIIVYRYFILQLQGKDF